MISIEFAVSVLPQMRYTLGKQNASMNMQSIKKIPINVFYLCFHAYSQTLNAKW